MLKCFTYLNLTQYYSICRDEPMTKLLEEMISQIHQLSPEEQDAIASRFLAELQDEQKWKSRLTTTTDDQWDGMAAMVRQEIATGETVPLSEMFPAEK